MIRITTESDRRAPVSATAIRRSVNSGAERLGDGGLVDAVHVGTVVDGELLQSSPRLPARRGPRRESQVLEDLRRDPRVLDHVE